MSIDSDDDLQALRRIGPVVVQASINSMASLLPSGVHTGAILFSNQMSARVQTNIVTLQTEPMDFLTEFFDRRDNDLAYQSITFTPDGSAS